jgi:hypothetical protein
MTHTLTEAKATIWYATSTTTMYPPQISPSYLYPACNSNSLLFLTLTSAAKPIWARQQDPRAEKEHKAWRSRGGAAGLSSAASLLLSCG